MTEPHAAGLTLLEQGFPFADVARLVLADRRSPDPAYQVHRWWARRPPALLRSVLLASSTTSVEDLWARYRSSGRDLVGVRVIDPFAGGGTTLVEAVRLGADVVGCDVDPVAVALNLCQLSPPDPEQLERAGEDLLAHLQTEIGHLWPGAGDRAALHYFTVAEVVCPECGSEAPLYRSPVLARSVGKPGAVVRDAAVHAFCPACWTVHASDQDLDQVPCCEQPVHLDSGTYAGGRWWCPGCGSGWTHAQLGTGAAPRRLVAVEHTAAGPSSSARAGRRVIGSPTLQDQTADAAAQAWLEAAGDPGPTQVAVVPAVDDLRPLSYGVGRYRDLFTARQWAYFTAAHAWLDDAAIAEPVRGALRLAVSGTVTSNNRLCGYATDYGRLAPLFSVRAYSLPALTVELNPIHPAAGRGTLRAALVRAVRAVRSPVRRHVIDSDGRVQARVLDLQRSGDATVLHGDATTTGLGPGMAHEPADNHHGRGLVVTDPPFFDFISYSTLSGAFSPWLALAPLAGDPLLPQGEGEGRVKGFGLRLGQALTAAADAAGGNSGEGPLIVFTYKGSAAAWEGVGIAMDEAALRVVQLWPVLADPRMGHHGSPGACEFDVLVVARRAAHVQSSQGPISGVAPTAQEWAAALAGTRSVGTADLDNFRHAILMASTRWGHRRVSPMALSPVTRSSKVPESRI